MRAVSGGWVKVLGRGMRTTGMGSEIARIMDLMVPTSRGTWQDVERALVVSQAGWRGVDFYLTALENAGTILVHLVLGNGAPHPPDECLCPAEDRKASWTGWGGCWIHGKAEERARQAGAYINQVTAIGIHVAVSWGPVWHGEVLTMPRYPRAMRLMPRETLDALSVHIDRALEHGRTDMPRWATRVAEEYAHRATHGEPKVVIAGMPPWRRIRT